MLPFISTHLLNAWDLGKRALHTAADDLESFLWVLVWTLIHIFKVVGILNNEGSLVHRLDLAFSSRRFAEIVRRELIVEGLWKDKVFKDLIMDWLTIAQESRRNVKRLEERLVDLVDSRDAENGILDELDEHCKEVYEQFIRQGFHHLRTIHMGFPT